MAEGGKENGRSAGNGHFANEAVPPPLHQHLLGRWAGHAALPFSPPLPVCRMIRHQYLPPRRYRLRGYDGSRVRKARIIPPHTRHMIGCIRMIALRLARRLGRCCLRRESRALSARPARHRLGALGIDRVAACAREGRAACRAMAPLLHSG